MQLDDPISEYDPVGQSKQSLAVMLAETVEKVPAGQDEQVKEP